MIDGDGAEEELRRGVANPAFRRLMELEIGRAEDFYRKTRLTDGLIGLRNSVQAAIIIAHAARHNPASRGCHYREDQRPALSSTVENLQLEVGRQGN